MLLRIPSLRLRSSELWRRPGAGLVRTRRLDDKNLADRRKKFQQILPEEDQILVAHLACLDAEYLCEPALKHSSGGGSVCGVASSRRHTLCFCGCSVPYPTVPIAFFVLFCFNKSASLKAREALLCSRNVCK